MKVHKGICMEYSILPTSHVKNHSPLQLTVSIHADRRHHQIGSSPNVDLPGSKPGSGWSAWSPAQDSSMPGDVPRAALSDVEIAC